jgi:hypothetical protein
VPYLSLRIGRVIFNVEDREALYSLAELVREAQALTEQTSGPEWSRAGGGSRGRVRRRFKAGAVPPLSTDRRPALDNPSRGGTVDLMTDETLDPVLTSEEELMLEVGWLDLWHADRE